MGLDTETLLARTNPELQQVLILSKLRSETRLRDAFALLDRSPQSLLRFELETELARWSSFGETDRANLLDRVGQCSKAEGFARDMAGRYPFGVTECLLGVAVTAAVWCVAWLTLENPGVLGWALIGFLGLAAGCTPFQLRSATRGRRWVREVLIPEADRACVSLAWLLEVIEKTSVPRGAEDPLGPLRDFAPALRAARDDGHGGLGGKVAGFGPVAGGRPLPGVRGHESGAGR